MAWFIYKEDFQETSKLIFPHRDFIICIELLAIFHPHFVIRIFPSAFYHPHFSICILSSAFFYPPSAIRHHPFLTLQRPSRVYNIHALRVALHQRRKTLVDISENVSNLMTAFTCFFSRLKLSMMTPINRFKVKKEPTIINTTK